MLPSIINFNITALFNHKHYTVSVGSSGLSTPTIIVLVMLIVAIMVIVIMVPAMVILIGAVLRRNLRVVIDTATRPGAAAALAVSQKEAKLQDNEPTSV